ncbi:MAG: hypothetical protein P8Y64_10240 [Gammaproteobacteria bacterium]|jgi:cyclic-di-GMP-binding protein
MHLFTPNQQSPDGEGFPTQPRKIKKWLKALPLVNMGETTREYYNGLRQLNRLSIPVKDRLEDMELMRPTARIVLTHLNKHLISRALPLPAKSRKIVQLAQTLMLEMAHGYKICVMDAVVGRARLDAKQLALTTHRAMRYLGEALLKSAQVYGPDPKNIWHDLYQLYAFAEQNQIHNRSVKDEELEGSKSTISDEFKKVCLLALSRPLSLRQGEADRLAAFLDSVYSRVEITRNFLPDTEGGVHVVDLTSDQPPGYYPLSELGQSPSLRTLNLVKVMHLLRERAQAGDASLTETITNRAVLGADFSRRLLHAWSSTAKRRFSRAARGTGITAALSLNGIFEAIEHDADSIAAIPQPPDPELPKQTSSSELSLQTIPDHNRRDHEGFLYDTMNSALRHQNPWDIIAAGNVVSDEYSKEQKKQELERMTLHGPKSWQTWQVLNTSAGGYCLLWHKDSPSRAQVGELVGLREKEGGDYQWRVGVVRWMKFIETHGLEAGIQLLGPKTLLIQIHKINNRRALLQRPVRALMLPGIKTINKPPSILVPSDTLALGDDITLSVFDRQMRIVLSEQLEQSSSFTQYRYRGFQEEPEQSQDTSHQGKDGFESLWDSL